MPYFVHMYVRMTVYLSGVLDDLYHLSVLYVSTHQVRYPSL